MSKKSRTRVTGVVMEKETGKGSKSHQRHNIVLHTEERDYHLRLDGTNPFQQKTNFEHLIGQKVSVMAYKYDYLLIVSDMRDVKLAKAAAPKIRGAGKKGPGCGSSC